MTSAVEWVTVAVHDLETATALYGGALGYRVESHARASVSLLGAWHYPVHADVRLVELSCEGYPFGRLRLAQFEPPSPPVQRARARDDDHYPHSRVTLELHAGAHSGTAAQALLAAGFETIHEGPRGTTLRNAEGLELRLLNGKSSLRTPIAGRVGEIARICLLAADTSASERFYRDGLGLVARQTVPACYGDRQQPSGAIEIRRLPETVPTLLHAPLPGQQPGVNLLSLRCSDLDSLEARLRSQQAEIVTRPTHVALGDGMPARVMLVRGPDRELLELVERDA